MTNTSHYDVVIAGAGLSGLTCAYALKTLKPDWRILVLERSGTAGGLTGNWIDHRLGPNRKLQPPMHMIFRQKYPNLLRMTQIVGAELSPVFSEFRIVSSDGKRHLLALKDWTARLPAPLHALGMFARLDMSLLAKWDLAKLSAVATYCAKSALERRGETNGIPSTLSLEGLEQMLHMGQVARDFVEAITPSIYNTHPWYTSATKMLTVLAGTMTMTRGSLDYHVFGKSYNSAFVDRYVQMLERMGVEFRYFAEVRQLESNAEGTRVTGLLYRDNHPSRSEAQRYVCEGCGAENYYSDRAFCTRCGLDTTLDRVRTGEIRAPVGSELWMDPERTGAMKLEFDTLITAMYPHMIAKLLPLGSPLRKHPYVRSFFSTRGDQTQLSIARVYYRAQVTGGEKFITGTHNPTFCFNGCQSVLNNFGAEDLGYSGGDVVDVLLDVGILQNAHTAREQIERVVRDLRRVYPDADPALVEHVSFASLRPSVLYLTEQPAIAGLHRFNSAHRTGAANWYVAGCHSGLIGIGMESAVQGALETANSVMEDHGESARVEILPYDMARGSRLLALAGHALWFHKTRGKRVERLSGAKYSTAGS